MNTFKEVHEPTIGVDFHLKTMEVDGKTISLQLWDIAGQDSFGSIYRVRSVVRSNVEKASGVSFWKPHD